jgi:AraC family transcriptional regulator
MVLGERKQIGAFVFVRHDYPVLEQRGRHSHPWLHLTMVSRGHYRRQLGWQTSDYKAGSLAFLHTNAGHTDCYTPGSECLHVVIPPEVEHKLTGVFGSPGTTGQVSPGLSARFFIALHREFNQPDSDSALIVEALLLDLVSRHVDMVRERMHARPPWLGSLLDYMDDAFDQKWSLHSIAAEVGVHPVYLCRMFSEHFGCTLGEYIRRQRVLRGWQLLTTGSGTVAEVALQSGFADQSHFTRAFKQHFGMTPGKWRRQVPSSRRQRALGAG